MSKKPIDALVINTHGFTFNDNKVNCNNYSFTYKDDINNMSKSEMGMTLSGLLMSGASMSYSPDCDIEGLEDGIITVAEVAQQNLPNVCWYIFLPVRQALAKSHQKAYLVFNVDSVCGC